MTNEQFNDLMQLGGEVVAQLEQIQINTKGLLEIADKQTEALVVVAERTSRRGGFETRPPRHGVGI